MTGMLQKLACVSMAARLANGDQIIRDLCALDDRGCLIKQRVLLGHHERKPGAEASAVAFLACLRSSSHPSGGLPALSILLNSLYASILEPYARKVSKPFTQPITIVLCSSLQR